jgi:hypothetical protein
MSDPLPGLFPNPHGEQGVLDDGVNPLDVAQEFTPAPSYEVRDALVDLVRRDLLGPWGGDEEQFAPRAMGPRERYLVGMLGPKPVLRPQREQADGVADTESGVDGGGDGELPEIVTPQSVGRIWASSMGLSCAVHGDVDALHVTVTWGRYAKRETTEDDGRTRSVWYREPVAREREVRLDGNPSRRIPLDGDDPEAPGVLLAVDVRPRDGHRVVRLVLVNTQREPERNADTAWVFQSRIAVTALDGHAAVFAPVDDPADGGEVGDDAEEAHLRLLYRHHRRYAAGHNVAVHPHVRPGDRRCAWKLETTWLPVYDVPSTAAAGSGAQLSMDVLAEADASALRAALDPLTDGYDRWLDTQDAGIAELPPALAATGAHAVRTARIAAHRIRAGIQLLTTPDAPGHADALAAFRFANRVMAPQRRHTAIARLRDERGLGYAEALAAVQDPGNASWRPFQLAFVLLNLPSLTDPSHPERAVTPDATVDLLFFPTGGGKTEAYLGLTAYTFAIRRLQGLIGEGRDARTGADGVAVLMRYTLRLLTAQQFQRAAALVCAAEVVRRDDEATWGATPFRIGLWVGGKVSPNWWGDADEQVAEAREAGKGRRVNVLQTLSCPWCGTALAGHRDLRSEEVPRRVFLFCPNAEGEHACPFSRTRSDEGLPVLTVDEEIYRYTPALVIATVDKLAQLPWRGFAGMLFGRVREQCPRHGYRHADLDARTGCTDRHNAKGRWPAVRSRPVVRLRPPDLVIQDELHHISGALGTTVGLFETAVDELCTWPVPGGGEAGPKIVASTATTKRAAARWTWCWRRRCCRWVWTSPGSVSWSSRGSRRTPRSTSRRRPAWDATRSARGSSSRSTTGRAPATWRTSRTSSTTTRPSTGRSRRCRSHRSPAARSTAARRARSSRPSATPTTATPATSMPSRCRSTGRWSVASSTGCCGARPPTPSWWRSRRCRDPLRTGCPPPRCGEGIFLRLPDDLLGAWEERVAGSVALTAHEEAYGRYRENRRSDRITGPFDPMAHWPGTRYLALHTLSHLLIRTIALECGYSSASLSERIYAGTDGDPRSGILVYTAVPDAEGTLGGLVSLGEQRELTRLFRRALRDARRCSSDPLCAERLPAPPADFLHGAACHVCLFVSETTCERGNKFLDRRFVVPIDDPALALYPDLP